MFSGSESKEQLTIGFGLARIANPRQRVIMGLVWHGLQIRASGEF
jgi:hypothetical protein